MDSMLNRKNRERRFTVPSNFKLFSLVEDLGIWLRDSRGKKVETIRTGDGYVVEARDVGGRLKRLVDRKEEMFHVVFALEGGRLAVGSGRGGWSQGSGGGSGKTDEFVLTRAAKFAKSAVAGLAGAAADGVADIFAETKTWDEILEFVARYVANSFDLNNGRDLSDAGGFSGDISKSRYVEEWNRMISSWLAGFLKPGETLLAWLKTSTKSPEDGAGDWNWMLTTHRSGLVSFAESGFESFREITAKTMSFKDSLVRDDVEAGDATFRTRMGNEDLFKEMAGLLPLSPEKRRYESARLNFVNGRVSHAESVLERLVSASPDPIYSLSLFYANHARERGKDEPFGIDDEFVKNFGPVAKALAEKSSGRELQTWARSWGLQPPQSLSLAELMQKVEPASAVFAELARPVLTDAREALVKKSKNEVFQGVIDIRYAENLILCGYKKEATAVLEHRLSKLPDETLADLLPSGDSDLTKGEGGQVLKTRILELLVQARSAPEESDANTLRELAMLQPLVPERIRALFRCAGPELKKRAAVCLNLLEGQDGPETFSDYRPPENKKPRPLSKEDIEEGVRHPASRSGTALNKLQGFIAAKKIPDRGSLKTFAKRVSMDEYPELCKAILDGGIVFGVKSLEAFVSFGEYGTGVRGYENDPPFILVGNEHLEKDRPFSMDALEARFAVGTEIAHVKFKYNRITSTDLWEGAFEKTISVMELVPVVGVYLGKIGSLGKFATHATQFSGTAGNVKQYVSHAWSLATRAQDYYKGKIGGNSEKRDEEEKKVEEERGIIGAFREMRLTSDRAGLILCGDLKAAVRTMFKSSPKLCPELPTVEKAGLDSLLSEKDEKGALKYQDLAIRLAALFSFYLSKDFARLRSRAFETGGV